MPLSADARLERLDMAAVLLCRSSWVRILPKLRPRLRLSDDADCGDPELSVRLPNTRLGRIQDPTEDRELVEMLRIRWWCTVPLDPILAVEEHDRPAASFPNEPIPRGLFAVKDRTDAMAVG